MRWFYRWYYLRRMTQAYKRRGVNAMTSQCVAVARSSFEPGVVALLCYSRGTLIVTHMTPDIARAMAKELYSVASAAEELEPFVDSDDGDEWKDGL